MPTDAKTHPGDEARPSQSRDNTLLPDASPASPEQSSIADLEMHSTSRAIRLLVILCLGALASFSLAPYLLTVASGQNATSDQGAPSDQSACTTQPQAINYKQPTTTTQSTVSLFPSPPSLWTRAGKNSYQFALAQACAATFTTIYESFNISQPTSLTSIVYMLSPAGKKRFFEGTDTMPKDIRMDATWQAQARAKHLEQSAQVLKKAQLQTVHGSNNVFSASFLVTYEITTKSSDKTTTQQKQLLVVLEQKYAASSDISTGWQIASWYDNANAS